MEYKFEIGNQVMDIYEGDRGFISDRKENGGSRSYKVFFSQTKQPWIKEDELKLVEDKGLLNRFADGEFCGVEELKRILSFVKIKGELTNIYYSMNNGSTEFFPHQFKPVLKFIESTSGRLLIADEVGLGKTIEAMYIWQELVARENSHRLLVICPSTLREKWKNDMYKFFSIDAKIVSAQELLNELKDADDKPGQKHFNLIVSLEGIRYKDKKEDGGKKSPQEKLNDFLEKRSGKDLSPILDMVVVDEAHNLRNSATANHKTVSLIRDNAKNVVLLSATPIQTEETNLYSILNILNPEVFFNKKTFECQLQEGQNYIKISNLLRSKASASDISAVLPAIKSGSMYQYDSSFIDNFEKNLDMILSDDHKRLDYFERFAQKVFYANYFTRTRKCDAFMEQPKRNPCQYSFKLNEYEKKLYEKVSKTLKFRSDYVDRFGAFQLITRQRQMASSLFAAFESWLGKSNSDDESEFDFDENDIDEKFNILTKEKLNISELMPLFDVKLDELEKNDSKYNKVLECIQNQFKEYPNSKIVLFSFYRNTIKYLTRRLNDDGIKCISMMGGVDSDKNQIMKDFREDATIRILLSTEVGSEGLDLQFCDTEINYDLPWNPMRLEQRIGRIDRIGQKAEKLNIINLACDDSIEDRVLLKLYDRIEIFKCSIGDIDEILGKTVNDIVYVLLDKELSDEEREKRADELIDTAYIKQNRQKELESKAANFQAFQDYIIQNVDEVKKTQRFVRSVDLMFYVKDYLTKEWQGCKIEEYQQLRDALLIRLSHDAARSFSNFLQKQGTTSQLRLDTQDVLCLFDSSQREIIRKKFFEIITYSHPLVKWITEERLKKPTSSYGCSSILFKCDKSTLPTSGKGMYAYFIQQWEAKGFKKKKELKYYLCHIETQEVVCPLLAEEILSKTFVSGKSNLRWQNALENENVNIDDAYDALDLLKNKADEEFGQFENDFEIGNKDFCEQQKMVLRDTAKRKIDQLRETIAQLRVDGNEKMATLNQAQLDAVEKRLDGRLSDVDLKMHARCQNDDICVGLLEIV